MKDLDVENSTASSSEGAPEAPGTNDAAEVTPEQLNELREKAAKADEHWDRLLRTAAEFENFRKRATREKQEAVRYANEGILEKLIPVLDNFDMAMSAAQNNTKNSQSLQEGVVMILQQLRRALADAGLEEIDATGKAFDPNLHEAIAQQPSADVPEGNVLQQVRKGYKLQDRLIRPASVVVAAKPA